MPYNENDAGSNRCAQIGFHIFYADLAENGSQACKDCRKQRIDQPHLICLYIWICFLCFLDHHKGACCDEENGNGIDPSKTLPEKYKSKQHCKNGA